MTGCELVSLRYEVNSYYCCWKSCISLSPTLISLVVRVKTTMIMIIIICGDCCGPGFGNSAEEPHKEDLLWGSVQFSLEEERPIVHVLNPEGSVSHTVKAHLGNSG